MIRSAFFALVAIVSATGLLTYVDAAASVA